MTFWLLPLLPVASNTANKVRFNLGAGSKDFDAIDENSGCDSNLWLFNNFGTANLHKLYSL
jgi:hypothetical protein